jgi:hypothetical protein
MHIFNVSITIVQGLKNVSLKVWEEFYKMDALCATWPMKNYSLSLKYISNSFPVPLVIIYKPITFLSNSNKEQRFAYKENKAREIFPPA